MSRQTFWARITDPDHWNQEGFFSVNETLLSCPHQSCIVVNAFAEIPLTQLFPELPLMNVRCFKHYQRECGMVPGGLGAGSELDMRWYEQQVNVDGQCYVLIADRIWHSSGDDSILEELYPSVKACVRFMHSYDTDYYGLLEVNELDSLNYGWSKGQYHDMWRMSGSPIPTSGWWLATLKITIRKKDVCRTQYSPISFSVTFSVACTD